MLMFAEHNADLETLAADHRSAVKMSWLTKTRPLPWERETRDRMLWKAFGANTACQEWEEAWQYLKDRGYPSGYRG